MKILYRYFLERVLAASIACILVLTFVLLMGNAFKRVFDLLVNYDVPILSILQMLLLLVPQVLTFSIPWGLLAGVMIVFGRASYDLELQAIYSSGIGLIPLIAPIILLSLVMSLFCFYNNAVIAPSALGQFKFMLLDLGKNNPTAFLRAGEPITRFPGYRIWIGKKYGNVAEDVYVWEVDNNYCPKRSIRAERGILSADISQQELTITLIRARQEQRGADPTNLERIQTGMQAEQLPLTVSLKDVLDASGIEQNITVHTLQQLGENLFKPKEAQLNFMPLLTEMQKRVAFSFAPFTFVLIGIPLAIRFHRKETSVGIVYSLGIVLAFYLLEVLAMALNERASAYPELIVWAPNIIFQTLGFWLLWRANRMQY